MPLQQIPQSNPFGKILPINHSNLGDLESLLRPRDIPSVRAVISSLDLMGISTYLFGSVVNKNPREYFDIDVLGIGTKMDLQGVALCLRISDNRLINIQGQCFEVETPEHEEPEHKESRAHEALIQSRAILIPYQHLFGRMFRKKAGIDLTLITPENYAQMLTPPIAFY